MTLNLKIIKSSNEFRNLRSTWNKVLQSGANKAITQTWEWLYTWWETYGDERELLLVIGYEDNEIIGIAPLSLHKKRNKYFKLLNYKTIYLLGSGKTIDRNVTSDYLDLIILQGKEKKFIDGLVKLLSNLHDWDEIILENVSSESLIPALLKEATQKYELIFQITKRAPCILIELPDTWDGYLKSIHGSLRYKIKRGREEFNKLKGRYYLVRSKNDLPKAFNNLELLHQQRWRTKGRAGAFSSPKWKAFHKNLMPLVFENGWLKLSFLEIDKKPVAANYNFCFDNKIHFFQSGMIPHENKHVRLGLLLHSYCIEEAIDEGYKEYDFLKVGSQGKGYKGMWENYSRDLLEMRISRYSNKENVYRLLTGIRNFVRDVKNGIKIKTYKNNHNNG